MKDRQQSIDHHRDYCIHFLYTHSFSEEEVRKLSELVRQRFGLESDVKKVKNKDQFFLRFPASQGDKFRALVQQAAPVGMEYKYNEKDIDNARSSRTLRC